jgi:histidinol-phosphate aminotransferase
MELNDSLSLINERIRNLKQYHLAPPDNTTVKLNQNENPFDWPPQIKDEIAEFCRKRPWNRYPNFIPDALKQKLSAYTGVDPDGILAGNGSNEMLLVLLVSLADRKRDVILCQPTFTIYGILSTGIGAAERIVHLDGNMAFDVRALCEAARRYPGSVMILCSPNNPTGCALSESDIRTILGVHSGFLILDQAYVEFGGYDAIPLLKNNPNLIITRTFSKAFAGAGLRIGYMLGTPEVIGQINKIKLPYNINFFSEHVAGVLLSQTDTIRSRIDFIIRERDALLASLSAMPFEAVYPSSANFIMLRCSRKNEFFDHLKHRGFLVRDVSSYPLCDNCLRVNVGTSEENKAFLIAAGDFFNSSASRIYQ